MIKYNLRTLISDKAFLENRKINYDEVADSTGISRTTLSKIASVKGYNAGADIIEKLCRYFNCTPNDLMTIMPDPPATPAENNRKSRIPSPALIQAAENI